MSRNDKNHHPHIYEKQPSRAYLLPMANRHATEHKDMEAGAALQDFLKGCPAMPKDEKDWLAQHYLRVHSINNTGTQELAPVGS